MTKLEKTIIKQIKKANEMWNFWNDGDKVLVGISGGKDSLSLLKILTNFDIELFAIHIKTGNEKMEYENFCRKISNFHCIETDILDEISQKNLGKNPCFVCSKRKRKLILEFAAKHNIKKIAFGHHKDDVIETVLLNMFFSREISTMMPNQKLFDGKFNLIRPFYNVDEYLIKKFSVEQTLPIEKNICQFEDQSRREAVKKLIQKMDSENPKSNVKDNIYASLFRVNADFLPTK